MGRPTHQLSLVSSPTSVPRHGGQHRTANRPKRRRRPARFGRYLGFIWARSGYIGVIPGTNAERSPVRCAPFSARLEEWCSASCLRPSFEARKKERAPTGERNCVHPGDDGGVVARETPLLEDDVRSATFSRAATVTDAGSPCPLPCGPRALSRRRRFAPTGRCDRHAMRSCLPRSTSRASRDWRGSFPD
jgi:hypothetical protein